MLKKESFPLANEDVFFSSFGVHTYRYPYKYDIRYIVFVQIFLIQFLVIVIEKISNNLVCIFLFRVVLFCNFYTITTDEICLFVPLWNVKVSINILDFFLLTLQIYLQL